MKRSVCVVAALSLCLTAALATHAQDLNQIISGTELHLVLQNKLTTATARNGDRFFAIVADPVYVNSMLVIPAGTKVNGIVGAVITPKHFPLFRGESAMSLSFRSIQIADREIPIPMSIVSVKKPAWHNNGTSRHDIKLEEGQILEEKADVKGYVLDAAIGTGGGSLAGLVFSHVVRGFGIGMAGSAIYILERKGKDVSLPPETGLIVRLDSQLLLPTAAATADAPMPAPVAAPIVPDSKQ
jgi:hypothetical protein